MKSQSENLTKEYNRMADERNSMEVRKTFWYFYRNAKKIFRS